MIFSFDPNAFWNSFLANAVFFGAVGLWLWYKKRKKK